MRSGRQRSDLKFAPPISWANWQTPGPLQRAVSALRACPGGLMEEASPRPSFQSGPGAILESTPQLFPASRPGSKPASQPASQPASPPASQPASRAAEQPGSSQPANQPASQPGQDRQSATQQGRKQANNCMFEAELVNKTNPCAILNPKCPKSCPRSAKVLKPIPGHIGDQNLPRSARDVCVKEAGGLSSAFSNSPGLSPGRVRVLPFKLNNSLEMK
jgi:hypothetical protein